MENLVTNYIKLNRADLKKQLGVEHVRDVSIQILKNMDYQATKENILFVASSLSEIMLERLDDALAKVNELQDMYENSKRD